MVVSRSGPHCATCCCRAAADSYQVENSDGPDADADADARIDANCIQPPRRKRPRMHTTAKAAVTSHDQAQGLVVSTTGVIVHDEETAAAPVEDPDVRNESNGDPPLSLTSPSPSSSRSSPTPEATSTTSTTTTSSPLTTVSAVEALEPEDWLVAEASARGVSLDRSSKTLAIWIKHAQLATIHGVMETLQTWLRVARQEINAQTPGCSRPRFELPELVSSASGCNDSSSSDDDLVIAVRAFRMCERATVVGGQAVLCRRICCANLYRLNERVRGHSERGWGSRGVLFRLCYPQFAGEDLHNLTGEARTALSRLDRDIHFGGALCRFADRGPCPEALLLLQPLIPDRFLRKLTASQWHLWTDLVNRIAPMPSTILRCLWQATFMIVNQTIDLRSYRFPLENVRCGGIWSTDVEIHRAFAPGIERLLTPVPDSGCCGNDELPSSVFESSNPDMHLGEEHDEFAWAVGDMEDERPYLA